MSFRYDPGGVALGAKPSVDFARQTTCSEERWGRAWGVLQEVCDRLSAQARDKSSKDFQIPEPVFFKGTLI